MLSISFAHHPAPTTQRVGIFLFLNALTVCNLVVHYSSPSLSLSLHRANQFLEGLIAQRREKGQKMALNCKVSFGIFATFALVFAFLMPSVQGHGHDALAPAPAPTSDGTAIDQGIAYGLMLLALVLTYIIHTIDAPLSA